VGLAVTPRAPQAWVDQLYVVQDLVMLRAGSTSCVLHTGSNEASRLLYLFSGDQNQMH
jgi:hypothetical protein